MDIERLRKDLEHDEGVKYEIYLDHLGYKTHGIGHLCRESEPEFNMEVGEPVSAGRVKECFEQDIESVLYDCEKLYPNFFGLDEEVQLIIANMMFNLGYPRMSKFKKMKEAVDNEDWEEAAAQMRDSIWYNQVRNRAERLAVRMELLAVPF